MANATKEVQVKQFRLQEYANNQAITDPDTGEILEKPQWKTKWNYEPQEGVENKMPSETIPGQALSIAEMFQRTQGGEVISVGQQLPYLENEEPLPILEDLVDVQEAQEYLNDLQERIEKRKTELENEGKEKDSYAESPRVGEETPDNTDVT